MQLPVKQQSAPTENASEKQTRYGATVYVLKLD